VRFITSRTLRWTACIVLSIPCFAQQAAPADSPASDELAKARATLHAAEAAHPVDNVKLADALHALISLELNGDTTNDETLDLAKRELGATVNQPRSKAYVNALADSSEVYVALSRAAEGRPFAENAFEIAQKEFPGSEEGINAADELAYVCQQLGDYPCAQHADETAIAAERKPGPDHDWDLAVTLSNYSDLKYRMNDEAGAGAAIEEAVAIATKTRPTDPAVPVFENNLAAHYMRMQNFTDAIVHFNNAIALTTQNYGSDSTLTRRMKANLASVYSRTGQFPLAWKNYETALEHSNETVDELAQLHADFARSLASGGDLARAIQEALLAQRMGRESFVLQARTLPERQALAYERIRARGLDVALSVLAQHPQIPANDIYQEVVRSRALVADEMARRQKNFNASNDPEVARMLQELDHARADLLALEQSTPDTNGNQQAVADGIARMEKIERALAEKSSPLRHEERTNAMDIDELRRNLPPHSVLISYAVFQRHAVEKVDPTRGGTLSYMAFVVSHGAIRIHDLGDAKTIGDLVASMRASVDAEAHAGGLGSTRNERNYREAGESLRKLVWDPFRADIGDARLALVVPDGILNLIPFSSLPDGKGYLVEHGPVIHILSSERDLIPSPGEVKKTGLLAIGNPMFDLAESAQPSSALRDTPISCAAFRNLDFHSLPGAAAEVHDIGSSWRRWNSGEPLQLLTGGDATRTRFLQEATHDRVIHVATHAFLLDRSCGDGNPLLHSGLVFAGVNQSREASILTAQQIASIDLSGVDWAVLSACNTGNGELHDGEGVLGLERAFRVAGARSVVMTLWPVDDQVTGLFMHELYASRLGRHASTADAVWLSARKLLLARRTAGISTHPWYWAGFVGSGDWK